MPTTSRKKTPRLERTVMSEEASGWRPARALQLALDQALLAQRPLVLSAIRRARHRRSDATPDEVIATLEKQYTAAMSAAGAAVGGAAAAPGVGTVAAVVLTAGETVTFLEASALLALAVAEIHGIRVDDVERRRTLLLAILVGNSGAGLVEKTAGRTGKYWGRLLVDRIPMSSIKQVNKVLGPWFITKYGTKQGIIVLGRLAPFGIGSGIGAAGNAFFARTVVTGTRRAFGPAPSMWPAVLDPVISHTGAQDVPHVDVEDAEPTRLGPEGTITEPTGKYAPLFTELASQHGATVVLSLEDIAGLVGGLPVSARTYRSWWTSVTSRPHNRAWRAAGYHVTEVDLEAAKVTFASA
jgi:hypothetical protein